MADVLIAGGGVAGSALAILLGRRGLEVDVFERSRFPREKPCGEGLMPAGVAVLERLGLAGTVGGARFVGVRYHFGRSVAEGRFPADAGFPATGIGQRRWRLDRVLFEAASATPGVTASVGSRVEEPISENGRVVGLVVDGRARRGRLVVAADGVRSPIRTRLGLDAPVKRRRIGMRRHFRLASDRENEPWVEVFLRPGHELYVAPLPDREVLVAGLAPEHALRAPAGRVFESWWRGEPELAARLDGAQTASDLIGVCPLAGRARIGVAAGVVLLGDAAGFIDPLTGGGMTQALLTAELLAERVALRRGDDSWLWEFERARRRMLGDYRKLTRAVLWLSTRPRLAERVIGVLGGTPALFSHLVGVSAGTRRLVPWNRGRQGDGKREARGQSRDETADSDDYARRWT
jgi:flavin-dependent dehydrogenase